MTYYYVKQFSRYLKPGAKRIGLSRCDQKVEAAAAQNPDGTIVAVLLNRTAQDAFYAFRICGRIVRFEVPAGTITTLLLE